MIQEQWKYIIGYEGLYQISNVGRIASCDRIRNDGNFYSGCIRKLDMTLSGYLRIGLTNWIGERKRYSVARLVAIHFIPNPENKPQVNHINGDKLDNRVENLEWCTSKENIRHAFENGLKVSKVGENQNLAKLTNSDIDYIRYLLSTNTAQREIARIFNVSDALISLIKHNKLWKHI